MPNIMGQERGIASEPCSSKDYLKALELSTNELKYSHQIVYLPHENVYRAVRQSVIGGPITPLNHQNDTDLRNLFDVREHIFDIDFYGLPIPVERLIPLTNISLRPQIISYQRRKDQPLTSEQMENIESLLENIINEAENIARHEGVLLYSLHNEVHLDPRITSLESNPEQSSEASPSVTETVTLPLNPVVKLYSWHAKR